MLDKFESNISSNGNEPKQNLSQIRRSSSKSGSSDDNSKSTFGKINDSKGPVAKAKSVDNRNDSVELFRDKLRNRRDPRDLYIDEPSKKPRERSHDDSNLLYESEKKIKPSQQSGDTSDDSVFKMTSRSHDKKSPTLDGLYNQIKYSTKSKSKSPSTYGSKGEKSKLDAGVYLPKNRDQNGKSSTSRFRNTDDDTTDYDIPKLRKKSNYEGGEFAPVKFSDQSSIGSETRVYPHANTQEFINDDTDDGIVEKITRSHAKRPKNAYNDNGIGVQLEGKKILFYILFFKFLTVLGYFQLSIKSHWISQ